MMMSESAEYQSKAFYLGNPQVKRDGVKEEWTLEKIQEYKRCSEDPGYFIEKYMKIITLDEGLVPFELWDFQKDLINHLNENRFSIILAARQSSKCLRGDTEITIRNKTTNEVLVISMEEFHHSMEMIPHYKINGQTLFESNNNNSTEKKFIQEFPVSNWQVETDTGWADILSTNKTIEYEIFEVTLETNQIVRCADTHIFFDDTFSEVLAKDCENLQIQTKEGLRRVIKVSPTGKWENMYDLSVDSENRRYYSDGVLSHNSTTMVAYMLWYALFNADQTIVLLSNKGENSRQLFSRFVLALENVPFFLQPGTKVLNKGSVEFANNTKVYARATSSSSIRGMSCVTGDTQISVETGSGKILTESIDSLMARKSVELKSVLTQDGFKPFGGFLDQGIPEKLVELEFEDGTSLSCTRDHLLLNSKGEFVPAGPLVSGGELYSFWVPKKILSKRIHANEDRKRVYDLLDVEDTHSYYTNSVVSHNCNLVALDEFAFVERAEEFFASSYPVISSGKKSRVIIVSTPNGQNLFYKLWTGAVTGTNEFKPFTIHWSDVPGRDEEFKTVTQKNIGDKAWEQEYELNFQGSGNTLIDGNKLLSLSSQVPIYTMDGHTVRVYREAIKEHIYVMTVDVSRGRGQDYSTFNIIDVTAFPFEQVCVFQDNMISPLIFPNKIEKYAKLYNEAFVIVESNDNGVMVCNSLFYDLEYDNQFTEIRAGKTVIGAEMTKKIKSSGCSNLKDLIEGYQLVIHDKETIQEICSFVAKGRSYEAETGSHDDLVMNLVMFAWYASDNGFKELTDIDVKQKLYEERIQAMEEELLPFGVIDDGRMSPGLAPERFGGMFWERF